MSKKLTSRKVIRAKSSPKGVKKKSNTNKSSQTNREKTAKINRILLLVVFFSILTFTIINIIAMINTFKYKNNEVLVDDNSKPQLEDTKIIDPKLSNNSSSDNTNAGSEDNIKPKDVPAIDSPKTEEVQKTAENISSQSEEENIKTSELNLYFIEIDENGNPIPKKETRTVPFTSAILTASLNELFNGPNSNELANFIPNGSKINSVSVRSNIANIDLNEKFQFNDFGSAGILAQLIQIVYTCTEIPNVNSVQITINKKKVKYFGGEGAIELDRPLTRTYLDTFF